MSLPFGTRLGGIASLEDLRCRCVVDKDDCWHFRLADGRAPKAGRVMSTWVYGVGHMTVTRAAWLFAGKLKPSSSKTIARVCESKACCNPEHLRCWTRQQLMDHQKRIGRTKSAAKTAACRAQGAAQSVITPELRQWLMQSTQCGTDAAHGLGVSQGRANVIRQQERQRLSGSSVFSLGRHCAPRTRVESRA